MKDDDRKKLEWRGCYVTNFPFIPLNQTNTNLGKIDAQLQRIGNLLDTLTMVAIMGLVLAVVAFLRGCVL